MKKRHHINLKKIWAAFNVQYCSCLHGLSFSGDKKETRPSLLQRKPYVTVLMNITSTNLKKSSFSVNIICLVI